MVFLSFFFSIEAITQVYQDKGHLLDRIAKAKEFKYQFHFISAYTSTHA